MSTMHRLALVLLLLGAATPTPAAVVEVSLVNFRFEPNNVTIQPGDTVRFFNQEGFHDLVADGSILQIPQDAPWIFTRTFTQDTLVQCSIHPGMDAQIHVVEPPPPTTTTTTLGQPRPPAAGVDVRLVNNRFVPDVVTIQPGDPVRFFNTQGIHDVVAGNTVLHPLGEGWAFEKRFDAGVLLRCSIHPEMIAQINVGLPPTTTTTTLRPRPTTTTTTLRPPTPPTTTLPPTPTTTTTLPPPRADLELGLMDTPDLLTVNGRLTYTITVTNNGPATATGVQVGDSLPPGATVPAGPASSSQGECRGNTVTVVCDLETLAAAARATVTINVTPQVTGDLSNTATVTAFETDPNPANNSSTETTTIQPSDPAMADLAVRAEAAVGPKASDQGFTYTLTVTNNGPAAATGVQLTNDLPRGIALGPVTASQMNYNCSDTDPMLCALGELTSGAEATVAIDVFRTEVVGTLPNQAAVNGKQHDPNPANNSALTSALELPTRQTTCNSKSCGLRVTCNLSDLLGRSCVKQEVTLFVDTRVPRVSDERAARPRKLVRFASAIRNFAGGQTEKVPLKLTGKGTKLASMLVKQGKKKLRGEVRISNAPGGIDIIPIMVRLK